VVRSSGKDALRYPESLAPHLRMLLKLRLIRTFSSIEVARRPSCHRRSPAPLLSCSWTHPRRGTAHRLRYPAPARPFRKVPRLWQPRSDQSAHCFRPIPVASSAGARGDGVAATALRECAAAGEPDGLASSRQHAGSAERVAAADGGRVPEDQRPVHRGAAARLHASPNLKAPPQ
jgi:hypothetical protein